jgi:hypothetical protein
MVENRRVTYPLLLILSFTLMFIMGRGLILGEGYVYLAEEFEVYTVEAFGKTVYPIWDARIQAFAISEQLKMYLYTMVTLIAGAFNSYKLLQLLMLLLPFPIALISSFKLGEYLLVNTFDKRISTKCAFLSSLIGAFVFVVNPWFAMNSRHIFWRFGYAFLPLLVYFFLRLVESKNLKYAVFLGGIMALVSNYRFAVLVSLMFGIMIIAYFLLGTRRLRHWNEILSTSGLLVIAFVMFLLLSSAMLLPAVLYSTKVTPKVVQRDISTTIQRETLFHIFTTKIYEWRAAGYDLTYDDNTHFLFLPISTFAFTYLLMKPHKKRGIYLHIIPPLIFIIFILLTAKEINLDSVLLNLPASDYVVSLLRHARRNVMVCILSISMMVSISSAFILQRLKNWGYLILLSVIVLASVSAWPMFTGDMNGYWTPTKPPNEYVELNDILKVQKNDYHALWTPHTLRRAVWSKQTGIVETSAPTGIFPLRSSAQSSYSTWQYYFFDYYNPLSGGPGMGQLPVYAGDLSKIYSPLNIKYLIFHYDGGWVRGEKKRGFTNDYIIGIANQFDDYNWTEKLYEGSYISAFELENEAKKFAVRSPIIVTGSLDSLGSIAHINSEKMPGIIFMDQSLDNSLEDICDFLILSDLDVLVSHVISNATIIAPKKFCDNVSPSDMWSSSSVDQPLFQRFIYENGITWNWQFDYGESLVFTSKSSDALTISFNVETDAEYNLFIRYFKNENGGLINVSLDDNPTQIHTLDSLNKFVWKQIDTLNLTKGKHKITLTNIEGFNAVNLFTLIPTQEYQNAQNQLDQTLQNKRIIYILEAETDLYHQNATSSDKYGGEASNGEVLELTPTSRIWNELEILKPANYTIAIKSKGNLNIKIDQKEYATNSTNLDWTYIGPIHLEKGNHNIEITHSSTHYPPSDLDVVWLYSTQNKNETLNDIFTSNELPAEVISYQKIDPTKYVVNVNASNPFMLSFAEAYDPLWIAHVNGETIEPTPLYSVINGFWINQTGQLEITIEYEPQKWFYIGSAISLTTLTACTAYLTYAYTKPKNLPAKIKQKLTHLLFKK